MLQQFVRWLSDFEIAATGVLASDLDPKTARLFDFPFEIDATTSSGYSHRSNSPNALGYGLVTVQIDGHGRPIWKFDHQSQLAAECADVSAQCRNECVIAVFQLGYPIL